MIILTYSEAFYGSLIPKFVDTRNIQDKHIHVVHKWPKLCSRVTYPWRYFDDLHKKRQNTISHMMALIDPKNIFDFKLIDMFLSPCFQFATTTIICPIYGTNCNMCMILDDIWKSNKTIMMVLIPHKTMCIYPFVCISVHTITRIPQLLCTYFISTL